MFDVVVFAGTTEGCEICSFLAKNKVSVLACVATDYGSKSLKEGEYLKIHAGRLNGEEMENLLKELSPGLVLDATHPYAAEVTENIIHWLTRTKNNAEFIENAGKVFGDYEKKFY